MTEAKHIGIIAGSGQFPIIFAKAAQEAGYTVYAVAHNNETDPLLAENVDVIEWLHLGQVGRLIKFFKKNNVSQAVMMGAIRKTRIFRDVRPDMKAIALAAKMYHFHDDGILRAFADVLEKEGIKIESSTFLVPHLLAREGCWTDRQPSKAEQSDIDLGWQIAKDIGKMDIGQCIVMGGGTVLAVEAIEGTDATILRGGKFGNGTAVVVKVCKPNQDTRFDIPAIGAQTIATMIEARATALALEAGRAVVFDRQEMIDLANAHDIAIVARQ